MRKRLISYKWLFGLAILQLCLFCIGLVFLETHRTALAASSPISHEKSSLVSLSMPTSRYFSATLTDTLVDHAEHVLQFLPWERANEVTFSPDGKLLAVASSLGIHLYDVQTFSEIYLIQTDSWVRSVSFSPDGQILAAGIFDNTVRLWSVKDGVLIRTLEGHENWVRSVAFTPDGTALASASDDNTVRLWDTADGTLLYTLEEGTNGVRCVVFSPSGDMLASGTQDGLIRLWHAKDGVLLDTLDGHTDWVRTLAFSHDGAILASGSFDATARLWHVEDGTLLHTLKGHTSSVLGLSFSPDDQVLASGSVDTTIRLWRVSDGVELTTLEGHTDFVYDVDISPDGKILASGSEDSTVRLWDISHAGNMGEQFEAPTQNSSSDCRICHHPRINEQAVPVIEVRCDTCHLGGAGFNWCPAFPPSPEVPLSEAIYPISEAKAGVPVGNRSLGIVIISPSNGETIYSHWEYETPLDVTGQVLQANGQVTKDIEVRLEIWSGSEIISTLTTQALPVGLFTFHLGINPNREVPLLENPAVLECTSCHAEFETETFLPPGEIHLIVEVINPTGEQARDERWITVDISDKADLAVRVKDALSGKPISGLTVQAYTRLYEWRERHANAITNKEGIAQFGIEILSQVPTIYRISVPEQVVDGRLYFTEQVQEVVFPAGASSRPPIEFLVHTKTGQIEGHLEDNTGQPIGSVPIWVIHLPAGPSYSSETSMDGHFTFTDLPIAKYVLLPDPDALAVYDLASATYHIDLLQSSETELTLSAVPVEGITLRGVVRDSENSVLPFAWLQHVPNGQTEPVNPDSGAWTFLDIPQGRQEFLVQAPGYYSHSLPIEVKNGAEASLDMMLHQRPETRTLAWGEGEIVIPPESKVEITGHQIILQSGWIWGYGESDSAFVIKTPEAEIELHAARFALERLPQKTSWLYLMEGQAIVKSKKATEPDVVQSGMVVALVEGGPLSPIPFEPVMMKVLHPTEEPPLTPIWKPSALKKLQEHLRCLGIGTAQIITLITYGVAVLSLVLTPLLVLRWFIRLRKDTRGNK